MPPTPSIQITTPAAQASSIATTASANAPASVDSAGTMSSAPDRTTMTAIKVAASENNASRRAQIASREIGCSAIRLRTILRRPFAPHLLLRFDALDPGHCFQHGAGRGGVLHSVAGRHGCGVDRQRRRE